MVKHLLDKVTFMGETEYGLGRHFWQGKQAVPFFIDFTSILDARDKLIESEAKFKIWQVGMRIGRLYLRAFISRAHTGEIPIKTYYSWWQRKLVVEVDTDCAVHKDYLEYAWCAIPLNGVKKVEAKLVGESYMQRKMDFE